MKFTGVLFCCSLVVYWSLGSASGDFKSIILRQKRVTDVFANTRQLIEELVEKLRDSAQQAIQAVGNFTIGIQDEIKLYVEKIKADRKKLARRLLEAVRKVNERLVDVSEAIATCIDSHRQEADTLIDETFAKSRACADERIKELNDKIDNLHADSLTALDYAKNVLERMRNCSIEDNGSILNVGLCLAPLTIQAQTKGSIFAANSGISIARINWALGTLPAAFEICAGVNMMEASVGTAKIIMDIGSCSASSIVTSFG